MSGAQRCAFSRDVTITLAMGERPHAGRDRDESLKQLRWIRAQMRRDRRTVAFARVDEQRRDNVAQARRN